MTELKKMKCVPCHGGLPTLTDTEIAALHPQTPEWVVVERDGIKRLERVFKFKTYTAALAFTAQVAMAAEEEDHHPALLLEWGRVTVTWWTHAIHGLHQNDFIMAAKTDHIYLSLED
jgi:4a-hydroxytetrahydrobiopterin dehydratase